ncbi:MAG: DUF1800 family protein [Lysobacterales bacterium]
MDVFQKHLSPLFRSLALLAGITCGFASAAATDATKGAAPDLIFASDFEGVSSGALTSEQAARFLTQATFGPTLEEIDRVRAMGIDAWIAEQNQQPASRQLPFLDNLIQQAINAGQSIEVWQDKRQEIWWRNVLQEPDQLRQRMAFALSQILVVSDQNGALEGNPTALANFYDMLAENAFGNYRDLLLQTTLNPAMGHYLSMFRNRRPDESLNIRPDENYAREIMQLFSVGLIQLNPDGTAVDGDAGTPGIQAVPAYDQDTIRGFAHVFTGWNYSTCDAIQPEGNEEGFNWWAWEYCSAGEENQDWRIQAGWRTPMRPWDEGSDLGEVYHAVDGSKQLLDYPGVTLAGGVLPAGGTARSNMDAAIDNIFNHPNVGPFLSRRLIQRFTTSNPTPAYVGRVAAAFNNNGSGVRGDMGAVARAILTDPEARDPQQAPSYFGKLREPLLRVSQLWRALDGRSSDGRIREGWPDNYGAQAVQRSPTVFNFFLPDYQLPGELRDAGLFAPEFQITTDTYLLRMTNTLGGKVFWEYQGNDNILSYDPVAVSLERELAMAENATQLVSHINLLFMAGQMSQQMYDLLVAHVESIGVDSWEGWARERVQDALWLTLTSPEYVVEK